MNKLRKKIFWTILIILSLFLLSILFIFNYQNYNREKINNKENLFRMNNGLNKMHLAKREIPKKENESIEEEVIREENTRKFMDTTIYTILLDNSNSILEIISHTENGQVNENIKEQAEKIIEENKHKTNNTYIGNLYFSNFSYKYESKNYIILIDNHDRKERLRTSLKITIILFLLSEIIIVIISKIIADWIIKPVEISFNKQKQFIADASHELKTPLSVIMACAETLKVEKKEQKWLDNIKSESERMSKLIISLLDLAKVENEKELYEEIDLSKTVEKAILPFESLAYEKYIKLEYDIQKNIYFKCSSEEIQELLHILLDNAIKHSPKNGHIIIHLKKEKNVLLLEVKNKGNPIPKGEEEKIFERFYRIDKSRNRNENRYGLGLSIASCIVTKHNGQIKAFSNKEYTTFKVILKK